MSVLGSLNPSFLSFLEVSDLFHCGTIPLYLCMKKKTEHYLKTEI